MSTSELSCAPALAALGRHAANLITGARVILLFVATAFAVAGNRPLAFVALPLALVALLMDWLDGLAARRWGGESKLGGVLDIAGDRVAENVWWITFAWLRLIPLWVPVVVLSRGFITDGLRSYALSKGHSAFGKETMMQSRVGHFLVASRWSRGVYGGAKVLAFGLLFGLNAMQHTLAPADSILGVLESIAFASTFLTVALCLIRGIPVITAFKQLLAREETSR